MQSRLVATTELMKTNFAKQNLNLFIFGAFQVYSQHIVQSENGIQYPISYVIPTIQLLQELYK